MTDAAVIADSAPAPVDTGAPISEGTNLTAPLGSQIPPDAVAKPEPAKAASLDDSIDRAIAKSAAKQAEPKDAPKAEVKAEPVKEAPIRADNGKFAPKDGVKAPATDSAVAVGSSKPAEAVKPSHTADDAPARFTETAKAKWASADPEIRGEVVRMQRELTEGYQKHKAAAERDASLAEFHDMAAKSGTDVKTALNQYIGLERSLKSSDMNQKLSGIEEVFRHAGISPRDYAAHILNQSPDQVSSQQDATIRELRQELAGLKQQVGTVTQTFQQQREQSTLTEINKFAEANPRFEELADDIVFFMKSGRAVDLSEAYKLAERLNPAPQAAPVLPAASSAAPDLSVQPDKGQKSINGAPSAGFTSQRKKGPVPSLDEALDRAFG